MADSILAKIFKDLLRGLIDLSKPRIYMPHHLSSSSNLLSRRKPPRGEAARGAFRRIYSASE